MAQKKCSNAENKTCFVFVYGTLKENQPNHFYMNASENGCAKYICDGETMEKFPLIVATKFNLPFLLHSTNNPSNIGKRILGEIYEIDSKMLKSLDDFEEYPDVYHRSLHTIEMKCAPSHASNLYQKLLPYLHESSTVTCMILKCWIYHLEEFPSNILQVKPLLSNYDAFAQEELYRLEADEVSGDNVYDCLLEECKKSENFPLNVTMEPATDIRNSSSNHINSVLAEKDKTQVALLNEECILIDEDDNKIGFATKKECHRLTNIDKGMLHRAFSVFLFNQNGELLLQQRSSHKITFPGHWTNTCCSHPLNIEGELVENEALGVKRAAQRKLKHELGIESTQIPLENFHYITKIHYLSPNVPADGVFGEHEIDCILFIQGHVDIHANNNEVQDYKFVSKQQLCDIIDESQKKTLLITPWFKLVVDNFLTKWWDSLNCIDNVKDPHTIHRLIKD